MEAGSQDWTQTCGACHVGGGQMEYDRNQNSYSSTSPAGDYFRYQLPDKSGTGGIVPGWLSSTNKAEIDCLLCHLHDGQKISGNGLAFLASEGCSSSNKIGPANDPGCATVPHDDGRYSIYGLDGAKWDPSWAGAKYDQYNRNLAIKAKKFDYAASLGMGATATGFSLASDGTPSFTGITGVPSTISYANIQGTPNSQNCSVCHARDDATAGLDGMFHMRFGYGGYELINPAGSAYDSETGTNDTRLLELGCKTGMGKRAHRIGDGPNDKWNNSMVRTMYGLDSAYPAGTSVSPASVSTTNTALAGIQPAGIPGVQIPNSKVITLPSGTQFAGQKVIMQDRIPDQDIHDVNGMQCATCHYTLGSTSLEGGSKTIPATTFTDVLPLSDGTIIFPQKTYNGIDHQFAKIGTMEDTNTMPNINGTVSCESCHTTKTHPRYYNADGSAKSVTPFPADPTVAHAGFPAIHFQKISCTTCHIPEVYSAPGRLKYRDFSMGYYKKGSDASGGWRNMLDWNWDFITWGAKPMPPIHAWATRNGQTQIIPVLPSTIPAWEEANTNTHTEANSDSTAAGKTGTCNMTATPATSVGQACATDADCGNVTGSCDNPTLNSLDDNQFFVANPGKGMTPGPVKARDTSTFALAVENNSMSPLRRSTVGACSNDGASCMTNSDCATGTCSIMKNELNGGNLIPLFDGFSLADSWGIDTKPRIDAMSGAGSGQYMRIYQAARFDVTHGVVPKEWALGGPNRGGCISCHSSGDVWVRNSAGQFVKDAAGNPTPNPNYSPNSVSFFEGYQQPFATSPVFPGVGQYDLVKNWFGIFADYDGTKFTNGLHTTQGFCYNMCVNQMDMPNASCAQFCPNKDAAGNNQTVGMPTSNGMTAGLYFCDDAPPPTMFTNCGANGHLMPSNQPMGSNLTGYMPMGLTDNDYYEPVSGTPKATSVVGLQYQCASFSMTGADCNGSGDTMSCALSGAPDCTIPANAAMCAAMGLPANFQDACTLTQNPNWNRPMSPNGRIYANYMVPCWDGPACTMRNLNYHTEAYDPFLAAVTGFMETSFDLFMFYAPGTAQSLNWVDGIGAMTKLIIRETQSGLTDGCDPYAGGKASAIAQSPNFFNVNLNKCVPNSSTFNGTCQNMGSYSMCIGGAMQYQPCATTADCQGLLSGADLTQLNTQGFPSLLYSRAEIRDRFKINLQQSCGGTWNPMGFWNNNCSGSEANPLVPGGITYANARLTWPIGTEQNPDNPGHIQAWDEAGKLDVCGEFQDQPCCVDGMGNPQTCQDGSYVKTTIHMNQFLGFTPTRLAQLMSPSTGGFATSASFTWTDDSATSYKVNFDASTSTCPSGATCTYNWMFGDGQTGTGITVSHLYASATAETVTLTVNTNSGPSSSTSQVVTPVYVNQPPVAVISNLNANTNTWVVSLTDASTDPQGAAFPTNAVTVNWGDGSSSTGNQGATFTHTYTAAPTPPPYGTGAYTITLSVIDAAGLTGSMTTSVGAAVFGSGFTITGTITPASGQPATIASNILVSLKNSSGAVVANTYTPYFTTTAPVNAGTYTFMNVVPGTYTVVPYKTGLTFTLTSTSNSVTVGPNAVVNFTAAAAATQQYSIAVTTSPVVSGATITVKNSTGTIVAQGTTNASGTYTTPTYLPMGNYFVSGYKYSALNVISKPVTISGPGTAVALP